MKRPATISAVLLFLLLSALLVPSPAPAAQGPPNILADDAGGKRSATPRSAIEWGCTNYVANLEPSRCLLPFQG